MNIKDFKQLNKIIIIDDKENEGNAIKNSLESFNVPSIFHHIQSHSDLPDEPYKNLRIIFLDLLFGPSTGISARTSAGTALSYLSRFVHKNSFYTLVIWSSHTTEDTCVEFEEQLMRDDEFCKPLKIIKINKAIIHNPLQIKTEIEDIFNDIPLLDILNKWEHIVENSRSKTLKSIIPYGSDNEHISKLLNSLSSASSGTNIPKKYIPRQALLVLNTILEDDISKELEGIKFGSITRKLNKVNLSDNEKGKLNYNLIFDPNISLKGSGSMYYKKLKTNEKDELIKKLIDSIIDNSAEKGKIFTYYIDVTPLCDSANNKGYQYFVQALLHPTKFINTAGKEKDLKFKKGVCYTLDKSFYFDGAEYGLTIYIQSYCTDKKLINRCSSNKKLRSNIVIDIQHKLGGHLSRPGHVLL